MSFVFMENLVDLIESIPAHKALNNHFYSAWTAKPLPIESIGVFALNYWEFTRQFPVALAMLIANSPDLLPQVEYTKILFSEFGYGKIEKVHSVLFEKFCNDLAEKMGKKEYLTIKNLQKNHLLLEHTKKLIEGEKKLYSQNIVVGAGAQLALECQAYNMISLLYEGARNYAYLWPNQSSFHESCEFFYVHIGSAEKDHREEALSAVNNIIRNDPLLLEQAVLGFKEHLNLFANFWNGLAENMAVKCETI